MHIFGLCNNMYIRVVGTRNFKKIMVLEISKIIENPTLYGQQDFIYIVLYCSITSNGVLIGSVIGGSGCPFGPLVNPKGEGVCSPREVFKTS